MQDICEAHARCVKERESQVGWGSGDAKRAHDALHVALKTEQSKEATKCF